MPRAHSPAITREGTGNCLREKRENQPICHFTKREWALVSSG